MKRSRRPRPFLLVLLASLLAASVALFLLPCNGFFCPLSVVRNFSSGPFAVSPVADDPPLFSEESHVLKHKTDQRLHLHGGSVSFGIPLPAPVAKAPPLRSAREDSATFNPSNGDGAIASEPPRLPPASKDSATFNNSNGHGAIASEPPRSPPAIENSATFNASNGDGVIASEPPRLPPAIEEAAVLKPKAQQRSKLSRTSGNSDRHLNHSAPSSRALTFKWPKQSKALLQSLQPTAQSELFAARAAEFFLGGGTNSSCKWRFFMTWIASLDAFGRRDLLAVESLFKFHRDACLLIVSNTVDSDPGAKLLKPFVDHGFRVAAISPDFGYFFKSTPAEQWFRKLLRGEVYPGEVPFGQNLSNLLRLAILYKFGGVYLDTDVIILRSFKRLRNSIGVQTIDAATGNWVRLNNAVMVFDKGHPLLYKFIDEFSKTFDGSRWGFNGPYLVSRVVSRVQANPGFEFTVLPPAAFYPVDWSKIKELFRGPKNKNHSKWIHDKLGWIQGVSFAVHLWNKESKGMEIEEGSVIGRMLLSSCVFCHASETTV